MDVVDLGMFGGLVAGGVEAGAVADLNSAAQRPGEEPALGADVDDPGRGVEHDAFDVGLGEPPCGGAGGDDGAVEQLEDRAAEGLDAAIFDEVGLFTGQGRWHLWRSNYFCGKGIPKGSWTDTGRRCRTRHTGSN
jgi:hypothetical protein